MIDGNELMKYSGLFSDTRQLEKDYLINLMLKVFSMSEISEHTLFKGGTAMSYFYGLDRFSEDLDFTYIYKNGETEGDAIKTVDKRLAKILSDYNSNYTVRKSKLGILTKNDAGESKNIRSEFFIEGPLYFKSETSHKIKLEISLQSDIINFPKSPEKFISKYRDIGGILMLVMGKNEILSEKACSIIERSKARDIYDMFFLVKYKSVPFDAKLFLRKAELRKEDFGVKELEARIEEFSAAQWKEELSYLLKQLPDLKTVKAAILSSIKAK